MKPKTVKVYFANGDSLITRINGTPQKIKEYYRVGKIFNLGTVKDKLTKVKRVKIL